MKKAKLKWTGPGDVKVNGLGDFSPGTEKEAPVEVAWTFLDKDGKPEAGWEVTLPPEPEKRAPKARKEGEK